MSYLKNFNTVLTFCIFCFWTSSETVLAQNFGRLDDAETESEPAADTLPLAAYAIQNENMPEANKRPVLTPEEQSKYTLGKLDVIDIAVQRHPEVSGQYPINNEGKIQYEFVGDVTIEGMTKDQVKDKLKELLGTYIVNPEVNVKIVGYNSKIVYVIGEVGIPGKIFMRGDTITVREALVQAGLPQLTANTRKGKLFTPSVITKPKATDVDIYALLFEGDLRENLVMKPGDTLYVPPTFLAKTMRVINPVTEPITTTAGAGASVYGGF